MQDSWADILVKSFREVASRLTVFAPRVLAVLTLVLAGWLVAAGARRLAIRILGAADIDGRCARWGITATLGRTGIRRPPSELVGQLVFWLILLVGMLMAIEALEVPAAVGLAPVIIRFLPNLLVAIFVMVIGLLALLTLFPLGALSMAQAIKDDRTAHSAKNAYGIAQLHGGQLPRAYCLL